MGTRFEEIPVPKSEKGKYAIIRYYFCQKRHVIHDLMRENIDVHHEFIIQNHADGVSCIMMVFIIGLMFQTTAPLASNFIALQHNVTVNDTEHPEQELTYYTYGVKDCLSIFFYMLMCIVVHAFIQEYILDKLNRKVHLSKIKHSKFNESGQLLAFYLISAGWGANIIINEKYVHNISSLWESYSAEHAMLPLVAKFYFIIQIAYWLHCFPELYFTKVKREEIFGRCQYICLYLAFIVPAYLLNFTRVALIMLVLHYTVEFLFHLSRLLYFENSKEQIAATGFMLWNVLFVLVRLGTTTIGVLTFWYGLEQSGRASVDVDIGNFNTKTIRIGCLSAICLLQAWMMWNFITFQLKRMRERVQWQAALVRKQPQSPRKTPKERKARAKSEDASVDNNHDSSPVAENGVRSRAVAKKK